MLARSAEGSPEHAKSLGARCAALLHRIWTAAIAKRGERQLRVREMLSLGEKRFIAVIECDRQRFLLAGTPQNIALLQRLQNDPDNGALADEQAIGRKNVEDLTL